LEYIQIWVVAHITPELCSGHDRLLYLEPQNSRFSKKNDYVINFCHIQVGPHGFIITNKQKRGLEILEGNNRKSGQYRDHCRIVADINTYKIVFAKN
jgi:hypothetical protein